MNKKGRIEPAILIVAVVLAYFLFFKGSPNILSDSTSPTTTDPSITASQPAAVVQTPPTDTAENDGFDVSGVIYTMLAILFFGWWAFGLSKIHTPIWNWWLSLFTKKKEKQNVKKR